MLFGLVEKLTGAAVLAEKDAEPEKLKELERKRNELRACKALSQVAKDAHAFVKQKETQYRHDRCISGLSSRPISEQSRVTISEALSPQLREDLQGNSGR